MTDDRRAPPDLPAQERGFAARLKPRACPYLRPAGAGRIENAGFVGQIRNDTNYS